MQAIPWDIDEREKIAAFINIFRHSKKLEADFNIFERFDEDGPTRKLTYLTDALEKIFVRDRTIRNRQDQIAAHTKFGSASGDLGNSGGTAALPKGKAKAGEKGKMARARTRTEETTVVTLVRETHRCPKSSKA